MTLGELTGLLREDMAPALGVTEPGAIALCAARARDLAGGGELIRLEIGLSSGMYKNAYTCGVPHSRMYGAAAAAALGFAAGDAGKGLSALDGAGPEDDERARRYISEGRVSVVLTEMTSRIGISARLETDRGHSEVTVRGGHTHIVRETVNGRVTLDLGDDTQTQEADAPAAIHRYTVRNILEYARNVPIEEISFIKEAYRVNLALFDMAMESGSLAFAPRLLQMNGGNVFTRDERRTAALLTGAAIEARVAGFSLPAMSITGSGAHGIIATMPLYAAYRAEGMTEETLIRATAVSYLLCMYIKEYSGRLSAFCGCGIAAGTGMAAALCWMKGGNEQAVARTIHNMASSVTGMICDGGNQGCVMKALCACATAFDAAELALLGAEVDGIHGINGISPEDTMRNMGRIASPGMAETERTIVEIQGEKKV